MSRRIRMIIVFGFLYPANTLLLYIMISHILFYNIQYLSLTEVEQMDQWDRHRPMMWAALVGAVLNNSYVLYIVMLLTNDKAKHALYISCAFILLCIISYFFWQNSPGLGIGV